MLTIAMKYDGRGTGGKGVKDKVSAVKVGEREDP